MKGAPALILAVIAAAGCGARGTVAPGPGQVTVSIIELSGGASITVTDDSLAGTRTFALGGLILGTDGISLGFGPEVVRESGGRQSARIRFTGTVHSPRWFATNPPDRTVLPVVTGTCFIRMIGDMTSIQFYREHALDLSDNGPSPVDPYRFEALFSIEPPVLYGILGADELLLAGDNPGWRLEFGDAQKEACRRFLDVALDGACEGGGGTE